MTLDILLVESNDGVCEALESWFTVVVPTCAIQRTRSPEEGLRTASAQPPDLVILRTETLGAGLPQAVQAFSTHLPRVPVVVLADKSPSPLHEQVMAAGAAKYVSTWDITAVLGPFLQRLAGTDAGDWERPQGDGPP